MLLSKLNPHPNDSRIKFQKEGHLYCIDNDSTDIISVSALYKHFFPKFDAEKTVNNILKSEKYFDPTYKYYGMSKEDILALWSNNTASEEGTNLHEDIEMFLNKESYKNQSVEFQYFLNFYNDHTHWNIYRTEFLVFNDTLKLAGSIDSLFKDNDGNFIICDWKRSKEISQSNKYETGLFPLENLENCNFNHYCLQQNLYKRMIKECHNIDVKELYLIILHPNNSNYIKFKLPCFDNEIELLYLSRIKYLKNKGYSEKLFENMAFSNKNKEKIEKGIKNDDIISETIMETEKDEIIVPLMNRINTVSKQKNALEILEKYKYKKDPINSKSGLSEKQQKAFDLMKAGDNIFLTGTAGSGKSHIIKLYVSTFRSSLNIGLTSTTGVSAILIGGTTLHSFLGIGLAKEDVTNLYLKIKRNPFIYKRWKTLDVLIIDEVSMLSPTLLDKLNKLAKSLRRNSNPFGGIQVILTGDFLQLPVVGEKDAFCFDAECWESLIPKQNIICLTENFRQNNDSTFREILNELRYGILSDNSYKILKTRENVVLTNEHGILATKIFSLNKDVDFENDKQLNELALNNKDLEFMEYEMTYEVLIKNYKFDIEEKLKKNCNIPFTIQLCIGAQVMLLYNIDIADGLCNGSRGVVVKFENDIPLVKFINGKTILIDHMTWTIEDNGKPIIAYSQIPLKVAFAVSSHRVQGITIDYSEVDLANIFEYGQAYVALSRCKKLEGLSIKNLSREVFKAHPKVIQFYRDILSTIVDEEEKDEVPS